MHARRKQGGGLVGQSLLLAVLSVAASGLSYVYQLAMGRLLPPSEFAALSATLALVLMVGLPLSTAESGVAHFSAAWGDREPHRLARLLSDLRRSLALIGITLAVAFALASRFLARVLEVQPSLIVLLGACLLLTPLALFHTGLLQGSHRFLAIGWTGLAGAAVKLALGVALVLMGAGVAGAMGAAVGGILVGLVVAWAASPRVSGGIEHVRGGRDFARYIGPAFLALGGLALVTQMDVVLVKAVAPTADAGMYAGAATIAKAILFLPSAVGAVLFPMVSVDPHAHDANERALIRALGIVTALAGSATLLVAAFPAVAIGILLGPEFLPAAPLLRVLAWGALLLGVVNLGVLYLLATRQYVAASCLPFFGILQVALILFAQGDVARVAWAVTVSAGVTVAAGLGYLAWRRQRRRPSRASST